MSVGTRGRRRVVEGRRVLMDEQPERDAPDLV